MGIRGLLPFLRKRCPHVLRPARIDDFRGKRLALDGTLLLQKTYRSFYDSKSAIAAWHNLLVSLRHLDIDLLCLFDGPSRPKMKLKEVARRQKIRSEAEVRVDVERTVAEQLVKLSEASKLDVAEEREAIMQTTFQELKAVVDSPMAPTLPTMPGDIASEAAVPAYTAHRDQRRTLTSLESAFEQLKVAPEAGLEALNTSLAELSMQSQTRGLRLQRLSHAVPLQFTRACREMAEALGVPVFRPPLELDREAEELASSFAVHGDAAAVASEDTDVLVHGAPLLTGLAYHEGSRDPLGQLVLIDPAEILAALEMDQATFINFCILCGSDYPGRIQGIGPEKGRALLRQHGDISHIVTHLLSKRHKGAMQLDLSTYFLDLEATRSIFQSRLPPPAVPLEGREADEQAVARLLGGFDHEAENPLRMTGRIYSNVYE